LRWDAGKCEQAFRAFSCLIGGTKSKNFVSDASDKSAFICRSGTSLRAWFAPECRWHRLRLPPPWHIAAASTEQTNQKALHPRRAQALQEAGREGSQAPALPAEACSDEKSAVPERDNFK
jgi:hypothetical protein